MEKFLIYKVFFFYESKIEIKVKLNNYFVFFFLLKLFYGLKKKLKKLIFSMY
jgi:hypothetical protein